MAEPQPGTLNLRNLSTVVSVIVLVGVEVFGVAFAAGWALAGIFQLGPIFEYAFMAIFALFAAYLMSIFIRRATHIEPLRGPGKMV